MEAPTLVGQAHLTPWFVYNTLVTGRPGTAMPSWVDRFSNEELWQLTAFVAALGDQALSGSR
jgi:mono/diheme cytochrome c family protein